MRTIVEVPRPLRLMTVGDKCVFLGSCFASYMGEYFAGARLRTMVNPLGSLYSPAALGRLLGATEAGSVVEGPLGWHSWLTDTSFSFAERDVCSTVVNKALENLRSSLREADFLFLTLGTSRLYDWTQTGETVVNCHKHPQREFKEREQEIEEMSGELEQVLESLHAENPALTVTLTVSPYRYAKYGFHESQLSKARLLMVCERLQCRHKEWIQYFPAYEIVLDELRDYRFYADDMLHVSEACVRYIACRMGEWMDEGLLTYLERWKRVEKALSHKSQQMDSPQWEAFRERTNKELEQLQRDYPMLQITEKDIL